MGRSAMRPQCASHADSLPSPSSSSPSPSNPFPSEPNTHEKPHRNPRRRGAKTQPKESPQQTDIKGKSRCSVPSQGRDPCDPSPSSRVSNDCSCAERPFNPQQAGATDSSPAERFMAREVYAGHSLDTLFTYASHRMDVFFTLCKVWLAELYVAQKPRMDALAAKVMEWRCQIQRVIQHAWPPLRHALLIMGGIAVALALSWLNCAIQGCKSLFRLGSAAFFVVICCSTLNLGVLGGFFKLFLCLVLSAVAAFFAGYLYALAILGIFSGIILWLYGSFWITGGVLLVGGILSIADQPRPALFVGLLYSIYSAKVVGGWLGLFLCLNLSFVFSSLMIYLLHSNDTDSSTQDFTGTTEGHANKSNKNRTRRGKPSEASDAMPSTDSHQDGLGTASSATTSEGEASAVDKEVERLLSCKDHYAVLELSRFAEVDLVTLKREYKKKAMLVHPDKNLGNAVAEEAFKRLQNAYEVLLDSAKKQSYDDELKREEVLSALKRFQQEVFRNGKAGTSADNWCAHSEDERDEDSVTRRVVCKKCNDTHRWIRTDRNKLHARWCQECQDHHQAKDGDGWVEQKGHAFFFGMFRKVDMPQAYACADSKIYEVTEWVQCQGMKCIPNTHKPSFHVSTAGIFKNPTRGPRTSRASFGNTADSFPFAHLNENMTEEEFMEWLENAMASGRFNEMNEAPEQADAKSGARGKPSKRKRKGKTKW